MAGTRRQQTGGYWANVVKISVGLASLLTIVGLAFTGWLHIDDAISGEARQRELQFHAAELQRDADDIAFAIYKVTHTLDEIEARAHNGTPRKGDALMQKQKERELEILLRRQGQVLDAIEDQLKEK